MADAVSPYAYVGNSPTNFTDPTGMYAAPSSAIAFGGANGGGKGGPTLAVGNTTFNFYTPPSEQSLNGFGAGQSVEDGFDLSNVPIQLAVNISGPCAGGGLTGPVGCSGGGGSISGVARGASQVPNPPNPYGSRGGLQHQEIIETRIQQLEGQGHKLQGGGRLPEQVIQTPGGSKTSRRPDITTTDRMGNPYYENVGRSTADRNPIARERRALDDIERATGVRPGFTPYDR